MQDIAITEIDSYLVDVSEEISPNNLREFIFFQLSQKSIQTTTSSRVFFSYLKECKKYFIAHFNVFTSNVYLEPFILKAYYLNQAGQTNQTDLFICDKYFALFQNQELIYFKSTLHKVSILQIKTYVQKSLCLNITNCIELNHKDILNLKLQFLKHHNTFSKPHFLKNSHFKELKRFALYSACCIFFMISLFLYEAIQKQNSANIKPNIVPVYPVVQSQTLKLAFVIESINSLKLSLVMLQLHDKRLTLVLKHNKKSQLIEFLTKYQCEVKTLQYNSKENLYELDASFELS